MITAKKLHPKKYRAGSWSKANMKWTRAEDWAAWERAKAEEKQMPNYSECEGKDNQGPLGVEREQVKMESDFQQVSDASA